jgi:hypothetical protein
MRLDVRSLAFAAGVTAVAAYSLCSLLLAASPAGAAALLGPAFHLDPATLTRPLTWAAFLTGLAFWALVTPAVLGFAGWLFNVRARGHEHERERASRSELERYDFVAPLASLPEHLEETVVLLAPADRVFEYLDDHGHLAAHMSRRSWRMAGSRMMMELDRQDGRAVGSTIRLRGEVLGLRLAVSSVVTDRRPPVLKAWQTTGTPRLLVIGSYRLGFGIEPRGELSVLCVFIDYRLPDRGVERLLGRLLGRAYARWCVRSMLGVARRQFEAWRPAPSRPPAPLGGRGGRPAGAGRVAR